MISGLSEKVWLEKGLPLGDQPSSSENSLQPIDRSAEQKLVWKVDRHLVPILFTLL
jgi:hypothetical protein